MHEQTTNAPKRARLAHTEIGEAAVWYQNPKRQTLHAPRPCEWSRAEIMAVYRPARVHPKVRLEFKKVRSAAGQNGDCARVSFH